MEPHPDSGNAEGDGRRDLDFGLSKLSSSLSFRLARS
jgi:hypothetical protein